MNEFKKQFEITFFQWKTNKIKMLIFYLVTTEMSCLAFITYKQRPNNFLKLSDFK